MNNNTCLAHHGILGQKWGIRRFQNKDGSLTPAGKRRADESDDEQKEQSKDYSPRKVPASHMSDEELDAAIARLTKEQRLNQLRPEKESKMKKVMSGIIDDALIPASKSLLKDYIIKIGKKKLGLDEVQLDELTKLERKVKIKDAKDKLKGKSDEDKEYESLKRKADMVDFQRKINGGTAAEKEADRLKREADDASNNLKILNYQKQKTAYEKQLKEEADAFSKNIANKPLTELNVEDSDLLDKLFQNIK